MAVTGEPSGKRWLPFLKADRGRLSGVGIGRGLVGLFYRGFGGVETHLGMGAVTEGLVHRGAAAAERKRHLAGQDVGIAISVHQLDAAFGRFHTIGPVHTAGDFYVRHVSTNKWSAGCAVRPL